jgi:copper homeostasis protein CutC
LASAAAAAAAAGYSRWCNLPSTAWQVMLDDIAACKANGVDGVVLGCLTPDGQVDAASTATLVQASKQQVSVTA